MRGFHWTMAIFAVASVIMFWMTFATTRERVTPPPQQKTNVREELGELLRNRPWVVLLIASVLSTTFIALQAGSTIFFFKYIVGDDRAPISPLDSTAPPSFCPSAHAGAGGWHGGVELPGPAGG